MQRIKEWISYSDQIEILKNRGLKISDISLATQFLSSCGYYRLSGYSFAMRKRETDVNGKTLVLDEFQDCASFDNLIQLYSFDKELRSLALDGLEKVEIALRSEIAYLLGKLSPTAYEDNQIFETSFVNHHLQNWINKNNELIAKSKEDFIIHYQQKYPGFMPIWVACQVWDFGQLSWLISGVKDNLLRPLYSKYGFSNGSLFAKNVRSLHYLRNICAHHSRLWNKQMKTVPSFKVPKNASSKIMWMLDFDINSPDFNRCFSHFCVLKHFLTVSDPDCNWPQKFEKQIESFPDLKNLPLNISNMGMRSEWKTIWKKIG